MLELTNISCIRDNKIILSNISVSFKGNKIYAVTGPNGSGKSSMAKIIAGIYSQDSGSVSVNGESIDALTITERARKYIAYSFQAPPLFRGITVSEILDISLKNSSCTMNKSELLFCAGLNALEYMDRYIDGNLSGGELKRIEIATVLARNTPYIILDEPEAGIDLWSFKRMTESFKKLQKENKTTFIIISHQEKILSIADEILFIKNGNLTENDCELSVFSEKIPVFEKLKSAGILNHSGALAGDMI